MSFKPKVETKGILFLYKKQTLMACITKVVTVEYVQHVMQTVGLVSGGGLGQGRAELWDVLWTAFHFTRGGGTLTRMPIGGVKDFARQSMGSQSMTEEYTFSTTDMEVTKCDGLELYTSLSKAEYQPCQMNKHTPTPTTTAGVLWAYWPNLVPCCSWWSKAFKAFHAQRNLWIRGISNMEPPLIP